MKKILSVVFMLLLLFGVQASALAEEQLYSEGVDTRCKVRLAPYEGPHREMFLSEGDRIAVITPSALSGRQGGRNSDRRQPFHLYLRSEYGL